MKFSLPFAFLLSLPLVASAEFGDFGDLDSVTLDAKPLEPSKNVNGTGLSLTIEDSYTFDSDFEDDSLGSISVQNLDAAVRLRTMISEKIRLTTGFSYNRLDFDSDAEFVPDQMQGLAALGALEYMVDGRPAIGLRISPGFYFIDDIDSDAFDIPTVFYVGHRFSETLVGFLGASYSGLRPDDKVIPIGGLIWTISDDIELNAVLPLASLDFKMNDKTTFSIIGEYTGLRADTGDSFSDDSRFNNTSVRYSEIRAGVQLTHQLSDSTSLRLAGGWAFQQEFEFEDPDVDFETDGAPFVGLSLSTSF